MVPPGWGGVWEGAPRPAQPLLPVPGVAGRDRAAAERSGPAALPSRPGMQALVLLVWTGALLGHGSCQDTAGGQEEVSRGQAIPAPP